MPIPNDGFSNAPDAVWIDPLITENPYNYYQIKTIISKNHIFKPLSYNKDILRYSNYCNTLEYGFLDYNSFMNHRDSIQNSIDLSNLINEEANEQWKEYVNETIQRYRKVHSNHLCKHFVNKHYQEHYGELKITNKLINIE